MFERLFGKRRQLIPFDDVGRYPCPFYGFMLEEEYKKPIFLDSGNNTCALTDENVSCPRESVQHKTPNWRECFYNSPTNGLILRFINHGARFFPEEFMPTDKAWGGLKFGEWMRYTMSQDYAREALQVLGWEKDK